MGFVLVRPLSFSWLGLAGGISKQVTALAMHNCRCCGVCPSAEERSDVSTRAQCCGQEATPPPAVSVAEPGDVHVDLNSLFTRSQLRLPSLRQIEDLGLHGGKEKIDVASGGRQHFSQFHPLVNTHTHTHTHLFSVQLV